MFALTNTDSLPGDDDDDDDDNDTGDISTCDVEMWRPCYVETHSKVRMSYA